MLSIRMVLKALWDIMILSHIDRLTSFLFTGKVINLTVGGVMYLTSNIVLDSPCWLKLHISPSDQIYNSNYTRFCCKAR